MIDDEVTVPGQAFGLDFDLLRVGDPCFMAKRCQTLSNGLGAPANGSNGTNNSYAHSESILTDSTIKGESFPMKKVT
jgi:hypothetical protein